MSFGLTVNGFEPKTIDDVLASIRTKQTAVFGAAFAAQLDTSIVGQLNGIYANEIAELWDLGLAIWRSRFPSMASGQSLDLVRAETGAQRMQAKRSTGFATFTGTTGTVPTGAIIRVPSTDARFRTTVGGALVAGTVTLAIESVDFGPIIGAAGTITGIVNPISGVTAVTNALDVTIGSDIETDAAFRARSALLLQSAGEATIHAIRADLLAISGVAEVFIFNNPNETATVDGLPPRSFEVVIRGGADQDIFDAILKASPAGIQSYGTTVGSSLDAFGNSQVVKFTRTSDVLMYVEVIIETDINFPPNGDALIKQAVVDYWSAYPQRIGKDVITNAFYGAIYQISGVTQIDSLKVDSTTPATSATTTAIGPRQIAVFDTSRVTVTP